MGWWALASSESEKLPFGSIHLGLLIIQSTNGVSVIGQVSAVFGIQFPFRRPGIIWSLTYPSLSPLKLWVSWNEVSGTQNIMLESKDKPFLTFLRTVVLNCMHTKEENLDQRWTTLNLESMNSPEGPQMCALLACRNVFVDIFLKTRPGAFIRFFKMLKYVRCHKERVANHWHR